MAGHLMPVAGVLELRLLGLAPVHHERAAGMELAARGLVGGRGDFALKFLCAVPFVGIERRDRREKRLGVGMARRGEKLARGCGFDQPPEIHDRKVIAGVGDHGQIVADEEIVAVDCSGLTETLFESELFGHERGAFTGASIRKTGLVEAASGGTLFLDEMGDIPLSMQVKLLRLLETGTYRRVGSTELMRADIRLISATHRPLKSLVEKGQFRQDLYYRINAFPICLPPLRQRQDDIPLLAAALLERVAPDRKLRIAADTLACLRTYTYPGNIRELRNILERASLLCDGDTVQRRHLPEELQNPEDHPQAPALPGSMLTTSPVPGRSPDQPEPDDVDLAAALRSHRGSRKALAAKLGLSERTLYRRLKNL